MLNISMLHFLFLYFLAAYVQCQDYSKIPKWADFGFYGSLGFKELDHKLSFIMDNYEIISIEKCTGQGNGKTVSFQHKRNKLQFQVFFYLKDQNFEN